jgi:hypothetical protein
MHIFNQIFTYYFIIQIYLKYIISIRWWEKPDEAPVGTQGIQGKIFFYYFDTES